MVAAAGRRDERPARGGAGYLLVIGAEKFSAILNPADRTTRAIFGDGAGAVVLRAGDPAEPGALGPFALGSDEREAELIMVPAGGTRQPRDDAGADEAQRYFLVQGQAVYRKAVATMAKSTAQVLELADWPVSALDVLVCHQANRRILHAVAARLGIPVERCLVNIDRGGQYGGGIHSAGVGARDGIWNPAPRGSCGTHRIRRRPHVGVSATALAGNRM
jgi:3-oxoacyl-[acyl-carrier-protein] synthase III